MSQLRVQFFYTRRDHFGAHSGIYQFLPHLDRSRFDVHIRPVTDGDGDLARRFPFRSKRMRSRLKSWVQRGDRPWYWLSDLAAEVTVARMWFAGRIDLLHYLDGEHTAQYLPPLGKRLRVAGRTIATFHQPVSVLPAVVPLRLVRSLDHVTLVADAQRPYFSDALPADRISVVHYGIDSDFFVPRQDSRAPGPFRILTTGSYLRDWDLIGAIASLLSQRTNAEFHVVSTEAPQYPTLRNLVLHRTVSDAELRAQYQMADLVVLPLRDATANNALLEAMACGVPIVASDLPSLREYAGTAARLVAHHAEAFIAAIEELAGDETARTLMARAGRTRAESLAWPLVARRYERLYEAMSGLRSTI